VRGPGSRVEDHPPVNAVMRIPITPPTKSSSLSHVLLLAPLEQDEGEGKAREVRERNRQGLLRVCGGRDIEGPIGFLAFTSVSRLFC
jgi:hypothetical protein